MPIPTAKAETSIEGDKTTVYTYGYDIRGNRTKLTKTGEDPETITYKYDSADRLIEKDSSKEGKTVYTYDENGKLTSEKQSGKEEITYEYTVEQRLSAVREGGALLMAASYDGDGNRIFQISRDEAEEYVEKAEGADPYGSPEKALPADNPQADTKADKSSSAKGEDDDVSPLEDTGEDAKGQTESGHSQVFDDPKDTIFWYGFGQGIVQMLGGINTAISAYLSDLWSSIWDFLTGRYDLKLYSMAGLGSEYSPDDIEAMLGAGLSEEEVAAIVMGAGKLAAAPAAAPSVSKAEKKEAEEPDKPKEEESKTEEEAETEEPVVIPQQPEEEERIDYELTYYVNDINRENTQVLMEYGKRDELKNVYTYGNDRISADTIVKPEELTAEELKAEDPAGKELAHKDTWETDYYLYDGRGSVAQVMTEGVVTESYTYDPFGNVTEGAPEFDSFYGYNGEETSPVTGMQYLRARYYDSEEGRFHVADTYLGDISKPLTLNRYTYTVNNPVMHNDPTGHFLESIGNFFNESAEKRAGKRGTKGQKRVNRRQETIRKVREKQEEKKKGAAAACNNAKTSAANSKPKSIKDWAIAIGSGIVNFFCDGAEKIGKDNGKKTKNKAKKKPGNPRKQMPEGAEQIINDSVGAAFAKGITDEIQTLIDAGKVSYEYVNLACQAKYGTPEESKAAIDALIDIYKGMYESIDYTLENSGVIIDEKVTEILQMAEDKGWSYTVSYMLGYGVMFLVEFFISCSAVKASKVVPDADKPKTPDKPKDPDTPTKILSQKEYESLLESSFHNIDSDKVMLGKYDNRGPTSYITKAGDDYTYFDLGAKWGEIQDAYGYTDKDMFEKFNVPFLDDAIAKGKTFHFSHNPKGDQGALGDEFEYLERKGYKWDSKTMTMRPGK